MKHINNRKERGYQPTKDSKCLPPTHGSNIRKPQLEKDKDINITVKIIIEKEKEITE